MIPKLLAILIVAASFIGIIYGGRLWLFGYWAHRQLLGLAVFMLSLVVLVSFVVGYLLS